MSIEKEDEGVKEPEFEVADGVDLESTEVEHEQEEQAEAQTEVDEKEAEEKEVASDDGEEEVRAYSKSVQKRINKLTGRLRESERREQAAIQYAQSVQGELNDQRYKTHKQDDTLFSEYNNRIDVELDQAKQSFKLAYESGDPDAIVEANQKLARLSVEQENLKRVKVKREQAPREQPQQLPDNLQQTARPQQPIPDPQAEQWAEKNDWFGDDEIMTSAALVIHRKLVNKGVDANSELYYNSLNKELREAFPNKFSNNSNTPQQIVAGARRSVGRNNPNKIKLTQSQISIANRLGVPLEQYAKQVQRIQS